MKRSVMSLLEMLDKQKKDFAKESRNRVENFKRYKKQTEAFYCFLQECLSIGYVPHYDEWDVIVMWSGVTVTVDNLRDFSKIHKIVGTLEQLSMEPVKDDARCRDVMVSLRAKDVNSPYRFIKFKFRKKLPRGSKCKVQKRVRTDYTVVCER